MDGTLKILDTGVLDESKFYINPQIECTSVFTVNGVSEEILKFEKNGDIFLHGKLIENDLQVIEGFKEFLKNQGLYPN